MLYLYVDVVINFMKFLDFKSNPLHIKILKIFLYFSGIPFGFIKVIGTEYIFWKWTFYVFGDINEDSTEKMLGAWQSSFYVFSRYVDDIYPTILGVVALFAINRFG